ncbi:MAG TPA: hypothetical protein VG389_22750 [Myxococcota bacterium]|nr:hypothetical protein [Myxococcota bacterium]
MPVRPPARPVYASLALLAASWMTAGCADCGAPAGNDATKAGDAAESGAAASDAAGPAGTDAAPVPCDNGCSSVCPVDDTVAGPVTFAEEIAPMLAANCLWSGYCHVGTGGGAGEVLTPDGACASIVGVTATQTTNGSMMPRITPGDPEASYLFHKVRGTHRLAPADGTGCRMPRGYCCLTPQQLGALRRWILDGAVCP